MSSQTLVLPFDAGSNLDRSTTLCLACSSSLPPLKGLSPSSSFAVNDAKLNSNAIFLTKCCQRPICPTCITSNPRLARYDPCLACLGGVSVVGSRSASGLSSPNQAFTRVKSPRTLETNFNLDGAVRDEDTFVLGDDEDDEDRDVLEDGALSDNGSCSAPPPPYEHSINPAPTANPPSLPNSDSGAEMERNPQSSSAETKYSTVDHLIVPTSPPPASAADEEFASSSSAPYKYYINRADTLQGISLRFGVDSHEICKLNNLPSSVMRTMPQLLHTRAFLLLPPSTKTLELNSSLKTDEATCDKVRQREENLVRERAGKKLQTLTKEVDWNVAKAYVALADDPQERETYSATRKEMGSGCPLPSSSGSGPSRSGRELESLAIQRYLEDNDWEEEERRAGRGPQAKPQVRPFPFSLGAITSKVGL